MRAYVVTAVRICRTYILSLLALGSDQNVTYLRKIHVMANVSAVISAVIPGRGPVLHYIAFLS